jgi:hypothetical protein
MFLNTSNQKKKKLETFGTYVRYSHKLEMSLFKSDVYVVLYEYFKMVYIVLYFVVLNSFNLTKLWYKRKMC